MNKLEQFSETVWDFYHDRGRDLPWRQEPFSAYHILVSEVMLQQTQVARVIPKYAAFLGQFPSVESLARASLADVLRAWSGLGYNRRAKYLHEAAKVLATSKRPWQLEDLTVCKGIGFNTAAAVLTYAYNQPLVFIETNIRTVYIHHFFPGRTNVHDSEILELVEATLDQEHPREWYWALMDYGSHLKNTIGNTARASKHYAKQSKFEGSRRQIRGQVLKLLASQPQDFSQLRAQLSDERLLMVLEQLEREGLISTTNKRYLLTT